MKRIFLIGLAGVLLALGMTGCDDVVSGAKKVASGYTLTLARTTDGQSYTAELYSYKVAVGGGAAQSKNGSAIIKFTPYNGNTSFTGGTYTVRVTSGYIVKEKASVVFTTGGNTPLDWDAMPLIEEDENKEEDEETGEYGEDKIEPDEPESKTYTNGNVTLTLTEIIASKSEGVLAGTLAASGESDLMFSVSDPQHGERFYYTLSVNGTLVSAGTVTVGSSEWTFTSNNGDVWTAPVIGGSLVFSGETVGGYFTLPLKPEGGDNGGTGGDTGHDGGAQIEPSYSISLSKSGTYPFTPVVVNYEAQDALEVTITNTGTGATGTLAVAVSNQNAFTVSQPDPSSIAANNGIATFTVSTVAGLGVGNYTAIVTVSGTNVESKTFDVSFKVLPSAAEEEIYDIRLAPETWEFPPAIFGYGAQTAQTVTVKNEGNMPTGDLTISLNGSTDFEITTPETGIIDSISVGDEATFSIRPRTDLPVGPYTATVTVGNVTVDSKTFNVSFRVDAARYEISLTPENHTFTDAIEGYVAQAAQTVTVENKGNQPTGDLTVSASADFEVAKASDDNYASSIIINSISISTSDSFKVRPRTGRTAGPHNGTVTVSNVNVPSASFGVSFEVEEARYEISLTPENHTFTGAIEGYVAPAAQTVTVENKGNQPTGNLTVSASADFEVAKASDDNYASSIIINSISISTSDSFKVRPRTGRAAGIHNGTVTVGNANVPSASFGVSFEVEAARYEISLDVSGTHTFSAADASYSAQPAKTVTITNDGNVSTGNLTVSAIGDFEVAKASDNDYASSITISSISTSDSFKVRPKTGLTARTAPYTGTVEVYNAKVVAKTFTVSFTVTIPYGIRLSAGSSTFPELYEGYGYSTSILVTAYNIGRLVTGALAIGIAEGTFTASPSSLSSIPVGSDRNFMVTPRTGLQAGLHTATITVSNSNGISESVVLTFNVKQPIIYELPVKKLFANGESSETVELSGLGGNSVYIVKVNTSASQVTAFNTGSVTASSLSGVSGQSASSGAAPLQSGAAAPTISGPVSGIFRDRNGQLIYRYEPQHTEPDVLPPFQHRSAAQKSGSLQNMTAAVQSVVGDSTSFFVTNSGGTVFTPINAKLRATGTHSNIWVAEGNTNGQYNNYSDTSTSSTDNKITSAQAQEMAAKFDLIYEKETALFGFEYGGGLAETDPNYGGVDYDPKIQILVHDVYGDYDINQNAGTAGYFYSVDEYTQDYWNGTMYKSNAAEIFYIDAHFADRSPQGIYSTLAHEFQHMIHFNRKKNLNSGTWYNEMLSMLAEDVIDPFIGIAANTDGHPVADRIPEFLGYYNQIGAAVWIPTSYNVLYSYANSYAFGAYLVRNFGGAKLIQELMSNDSVDIASVTDALASTANPLRSEVNTFDKALRRYGEALVFNQPTATRPSGVLSFNNTVSEIIDGNNYEFTGFDIRQRSNSYNHGFGPRVFDADNNTYAMNGRTMLLQSKTAWQNISGGLSITVQKPESSDIEVYVMVR